MFPAYMLSAVITTRHSYPAVPLAGQLVDQRSVHPGPLVASSPISRSADYIFIRSRESGRGRRHLSHRSSHSLWNDSSAYDSAYLSTQVVTGSINVLKNGEVRVSDGHASPPMGRRLLQRVSHRNPLSFVYHTLVRTNTKN